MKNTKRVKNEIYLKFITIYKSIFYQYIISIKSTIQSGIYGTNFKDSLLSNISTNTGNYLFKKAGDIGLITNSKDGSLTKTALHSLIGGSINAIQGESFLDGAIISGINEMLTPLYKNIKNHLFKFSMHFGLFHTLFVFSLLTIFNTCFSIYKSFKLINIIYKILHQINFQ